MASAGAKCVHVEHVSSQLPYAVLVALISFINYIIAGFVRNWVICLAIGLIMTVFALLLVKYVLNNKDESRS